MTKKTITKRAVELELKQAEKRLAEIERHTGARLSLNTEKIMNDPNRARALENLKNIDWNKLEQGKSFTKGFVNMTVQGKYWTSKGGWISTETEVQEGQAVRLLKATAKREKLTGEMKQISISGDVEKAIKYMNYFKTEKQVEKYEKTKTNKLIKNFRNNLDDMIRMSDTEIPEKEKKKLRRIKKLANRNKELWRKLIEDNKLYDIAGVNMYDSDDQSVDLKNNADDIIEAIESAVLSDTGMTLEELDAASLHELKKGTQTRRKVKKAVKKAKKVYDKKAKAKAKAKK